MPFPDLLADSISPEITGPLPEITISNALRCRIQTMLKTHEYYAQVYEKSVVVRVKNSKNYVSFPIQWFLIAVICKGYADALGEYCSFFDDFIRNNNAIIDAFRSKEYNSPLITELITDEIILSFLLHAL